MQWTIYHVRIEMVYGLSICVEISRKTRVPLIGNETGRLVKFVDLCRKRINKRETWHTEKRYCCCFAENLVRTFQSGKKLGFCSSKAVVSVLFLILCSFVVYTTERFMF